MTTYELRNHLLTLAAERAAASLAGLDHDASSIKSDRKPQPHVFSMPTSPSFGSQRDRYPGAQPER